MEDILSNKLPVLEMRNGIIHLILIHVKDDNLDEVERLIASVSDVLMQKEFAILSVPLSLVIANIGFPFKEMANASEVCQQTAKELTDKHSKKLKILYGSISGKFGAYGHSKIKRFGPLLPKFDLMLRQLVELNYGEHSEYRQE